jgi:hypothetical protein
VGAVEVHENDSYFYMVMDLCQGNLHDLIAAKVSFVKHL